MTYPIECSDEYGLEGIKDAAQLAAWLNAWMKDDCSKRCVIEKPEHLFDLLEPPTYTLAPAAAGDDK